jgi:riboflavin biosynthesis pyrimidine reductase
MDIKVSISNVIILYIITDILCEGGAQLIKIMVQQ